MGTRELERVSTLLRENDTIMHGINETTPLRKEENVISLKKQIDARINRKRLAAFKKQEEKRKRLKAQKQRLAAQKQKEERKRLADLKKQELERKRLAAQKKKEERKRLATKKQEEERKRLATLKREKEDRLTAETKAKRLEKAVNIWKQAIKKEINCTELSEFLKKCESDDLKSRGLTEDEIDTAQKKAYKQIKDELIAERKAKYMAIAATRAKLKSVKAFFCIAFQSSKQV